MTSDHNPPGAAETGGAVEPRFFIDHGMIHDRLTGKRVTTEPYIAFCDGILRCCELLNALAEQREPKRAPRRLSSPEETPDGMEWRLKKGVEEIRYLLLRDRRDEAMYTCDALLSNYADHPVDANKEINTRAPVELLACPFLGVRS